MCLLEVRDYGLIFEARVSVRGHAFFRKAPITIIPGLAQGEEATRGSGHFELRVPCGLRGTFILFFHTHFDL
jgi:hypothetical protein